MNPTQIQWLAQLKEDLDNAGVISPRDVAMLDSIISDARARMVLHPSMRAVD